MKYILHVTYHCSKKRATVSNNLKSTRSYIFLSAFAPAINHLLMQYWKHQNQKDCCNKGKLGFLLRKPAHHLSSGTSNPKANSMSRKFSLSLNFSSFICTSLGIHFARGSIVYATLLICRTYIHCVAASLPAFFHKHDKEIFRSWVIASRLSYTLLCLPFVEAFASPPFTAETVLRI